MLSQEKFRSAYRMNATATITSNVNRLALCSLLVILVIVGCRPQAEGSAAALPTAGAGPAAAPDLESAAKVANAFLTAWQEQNFNQMHRLLTGRLQEATPIDDFRRAYQQAQSTMTLKRLEYKAEALFATDGRVLVFQHQMTFHTGILGSFDDPNRRLHLVVDPSINQWRVAWSPGDIFVEMGTGARLVFQPQIPGRANIYDRNGESLADQYGRMARIYVNNAGIPDRSACFQMLAEAQGKPVSEFSELFDQRSGADWLVDAGLLEPQVYIRHGDKIEKSCKAEFEQEATRRYVNGTLMPHILGHVGYPDADHIPGLEAIGYNAGTIIGKAAIEASWNDTLAGRPGGKLSLVSPTGARLRLLSEVDSHVPESIWLTIDSKLQENIVRLLDEAYRTKAWGRISYGAAVVVMDVNNGEVLAMVSYPSYDGNALNPFPVVGRETANKVLERLAQDERKPQINRATQGLYPVGSVMKGLSAIAALESGVYDESTRYYCTGSWTRGFNTLYDWLPGGHGSMSAQTGITHSCNPFFYELGFRLNAQDPNLLPAFAAKFGLGQLTGINAIAELRGNIPSPDNVLQTTGLPWSYAFAVNLSIGQGEVQITPLQMVRLYAAIANGGYLLRPLLVRERGILDQRELVAKRDVMNDTRVSPDNLAIVQRGMCGVVSGSGGTAAHQFLYSPLLDVGACGKTGTAQSAGDDELPHSWFIAYAPAKDPQIAIVTMVENSGEGSAIAAPLTRSILEYYFFGAF